MKKIARMESLQEIIADMTENTETNDMHSADSPSQRVAATFDVSLGSNSGPAD